MRFLRRPSVLALIVLGAAVGTVATAATLNDGAGGGPPGLDTPQSASAESAGVRLTASRSGFSGTATFVEFTAAVPSGGPDAVEVEILAESFTSGSLGLAPGQPSVSISTAQPTIMRLGPASPGTEPIVEFNRVNLVRSDGSTVAVDGQWRLSLKPPENLRERLRLEYLAGSDVTDSGVRVSIEGAVRSVTETLLTVRIESTETLKQLGQPTILTKNGQLTGTLVSSDSEQRLATYAFPATAFGSATEIRFGPFTKSSAKEAWSAAIDLGAVLSRNAISGRNGESATVSAADLKMLSGVPIDLKSIRFTDSIVDSLQPGRNTAITFVFGRVLAPWEGPRPTFTATNAAGKSLDPGPIGAGYSKDTSGVISSPRTEVSFMYDAVSELRGSVVVSYEGLPEDLVRGNWTVKLAPVR